MKIIFKIMNGILALNIITIFNYRHF